MKPRIILFLFALCGLLLLSACAPSPTSVSAPAPSESISTPQPAPLPEQKDARPLKMTMALSSMGIFSGEIAGNQDGAYCISSDSNSGDYSGVLLYYDYATRQLIYLSDQLIVTYDEENPGWLEDTFGGAHPLAVNGKLYVVKYGTSPIPRIQYEGSPSFLLEMEPNAANRKKLTVPRGSLLQYNTGIAADGKYLYLLLTDYDANAMQLCDVSLCRADFSRGTYERLYSFGVEKNTSIIGVYPEGIVLQRSWMPAEYADADRQDQISHTKAAIQLYSLVDNTLTDTDFTWDLGDLSFVLGQNVIYCVKSDNARLIAHDLHTGAEQILEEDLLKGIRAENEAHRVFLTGSVYDGHILFTASTDDDTAYYSYSLATQEILPLSLSFEHEGGMIPVLIAAENKDFFMVNYGFDTVPRTATGTDGSYYTFETQIMRYALITKENYWHSLPEFLPFDDSLLHSANLSP